MSGLIVLAVTLAAATCLGLWLRHRGGRRLRRSVPPTGQPVLTPADLGHDLGRTATFVQFSTAFCQPCRATRQVLAHAVSAREGIVHVDLDAESHLDLVRRLGITRTPTTLVLDAEGHIVRRAAGALRLVDVRGVLAEVTDV